MKKRRKGKQPFRNRARGTGGLLRQLRIESLELRALMAGDVVISEFLASNQANIIDEDGQFPDWIELHNTTAAPISLNGWYLTDNASRLDKWRFPNVTIAADGYMVIFASDKDRAVAGQPLHTNFKIDADGEYLGLVRPNAITIEHQYAPEYPPQTTDVSYGISPEVITTTLVESNSIGKFHVPASDVLGTTWTGTSFNDAAWTSVTTGIGFQQSTPKVAYGNLVGATGSHATTLVRGMDFVVNSPISITKLGVFDSGANGISSSLTAQLFTRDGNSGTSIASLQFTNANPGTLVGSSRFKTLSTPIVLQPGNYTIASYGWSNGGGNDPMGNESQGGPSQAFKTLDTGDGAVSFVGSGRSRSGGSSQWGQFPNVPDTGTPNKYSAGTFEFVASTVTAEAPPIAYYSFDNTGADGSGNNYHGTLSGPSYSTDVPSAIGQGKSLEFSGSGKKFTTGNLTPGFVSDDTITLSVWFKPRAGGTGGVVVDEVGSPSSPVWHDSQIEVQSNGEVRGQVWNMANISLGNATFGQWNHAVLRYTKATQRLDGFLNGQLSASISTGDRQAPWENGFQQYFMLGQADTTNMGNGGYFDGWIDEFAVWNQSLSNNQVGSLHAGYSPLDVRGIAGEVDTSVASAMANINATGYLRLPFTVADASLFGDLKLRVKYDDGFVAYLNGQEISRRNAPVSTTWNSVASGPRGNPQAVTFEEIDVASFSNSLVTGNNVLAFQALNVSASDSDMLLLPELLNKELIGVTEHYYNTPSPGAANLDDFLLQVEDTTFSHDRGFYDAPFNLTISTPTAGATIRYTTDGSLPTTTNGTIYAGPINVSGTTTIRAIAYKTGSASTNFDTQTYLFTSDVILQSPNGEIPAGFPGSSVNGQNMNYGMDPDIVNSSVWGPQLEGALKAIPTISLVTDLNNLFNPSTGIYVNPGGEGSSWERPTSAELIFADGTEGFQIDAGLRIRGGFSRTTDNPKHAFRLLFKGQYGDPKLEYPLFGPDEISTFDNLDMRTSQNYSWAFQNDGNMTMTRDIFSRDTQRDMGEAYTRGFEFHLYLNGQYWGVYQTEERPEASYGETHFGGDKGDYDVIKVDPQLGYTIEATDGNTSAWFNLWDKANQVAAAGGGAASDALYQQLMGNNPDGTRNFSYPVLLDAENLVDYMLVIFYGGNLDAPLSAFLGNSAPNNWYGIYNRNNPDGFKFISHDAEHTLLNVNEDRTGPFGDAGDFARSNPQWINQKLLASPQFRQLWADRVQKIMFNDGALTPEAARARHDLRTEELEEAIIAESARWGDSRKGVGEAPFTKFNWEAAVANINNNFLPGRSAVLLSQLLADGMFSTLVAPIFSQRGGHVTPGLTVGLTAAAGTIYYTTDGSDPRALDGGVSPTAIAYSGVIPINDSVTIRTRAFSSGVWSAIDEATFAMDASNLRVTEMMYGPAPPASGSPYTSEDYEYIELKNTGATPLDLEGIKFTDGIDFTFPATILGAGQYVVVARNPTAFADRFGTSITPIGAYTGNLANEGDDLLLVDALGETILDYSYDGQWYPLTNGQGFSLVIVDALAAANTWGLKSSWRPSQFFAGNPGGGDGGLNPGSLVINELLAHSDQPEGDKLELRNNTAAAINIGGWWVSDDVAALAKYRFAPNTIIPAGGFLVINQRDHFDSATNPNALSPFGFSELGDSVFLTSTDGGGNPAGYRDQHSFGASESERPFTRYVTSVGDVDFVAESASTFNAPNTYPLIGRIVLNEVHYNPATGGDEYIELFNPTGSAVPLFDPANPTNTWKLTAGVAFTFPQNTTIPAGGYALVVGISPTSFRNKYGIPGQVPIFGPFTGLLDNAGESVELSKPTTPEPGGFVPYVLVDRVQYDDEAPWTTLADGVGSSLARLVPLEYGNDVINWSPSSVNTPGGENDPFDVSPPTVPANVTANVQTSSRIVLSWTESVDPDSFVLSYRVYRDGSLLGTTSTTNFADLTVAPGVSYSYQVSAVNRDGYESALSTPPATVGILGIAWAVPTSSTTLQVRFTEAVTAASAQVAGKYALSSGSVLSAVLSGDGLTATLTTSALASSASYTLSASNIVAMAGNVTPPGTRTSFRTGPGSALRGEYYPELDFIGGPPIVRLDGPVNFDWGDTLPPHPQIAANTHSTRWTGQVIIPTTGSYTFTSWSDDGVRLWIDGQQVVDNWTLHGPTFNSAAPISLAEGQRVSVQMDHFQNFGYAVAGLYWSGPGITNQAIPASQLLAPGVVNVVDASVLESDSGVRYLDFALDLSSPSSQSVLVTYTTVSGSASPTLDYAEVSGVITFAAGETSKIISVPVLPDNLNEGNETFQLVINTVFGADLGDTSAVGTIIDDDAGVRIPGDCDLDGDVDFDDAFTLVNNYGIQTGATWSMGDFDDDGDVDFDDAFVQINNYGAGSGVAGGGSTMHGMSATRETSEEVIAPDIPEVSIADGAAIELEQQHSLPPVQTGAVSGLDIASGMTIEAFTPSSFALVLQTSELTLALNAKPQAIVLASPTTPFPAAAVEEPMPPGSSASTGVAADGVLSDDLYGLLASDQLLRTSLDGGR